MNARNEIQNLVTKLGDQKASIEILVPGWIGVKTEVDARKIVEELRELFLADPQGIKTLKEIVPHDNWCEASIQKIKQTVNIEATDLFADEDIYKIDVHVKKSDLSPEEIKETVSPMLKGREDENHPQKILRIDVFGQWAAITVLRPQNLLSF